MIFHYSSKRNVNNSINKSELIDEWLRNAISSGLSVMLTKFWFKFLNNVGLKDKAVVGNARPFWNYELDKDSIQRLLAAFSRLYPRINHELNEILDNLPQSIKLHKEFVSELEEWYKQQESCEHEWGKPKKKSHVKQCVKCKHVQRN
jgi:hypothetical protein